MEGVASVGLATATERPHRGAVVGVEAHKPGNRGGGRGGCGWMGVARVCCAVSLTRRRRRAAEHSRSMGPEPMSRRAAWMGPSPPRRSALAVLVPTPATWLSIWRHCPHDWMACACPRLDASLATAAKSSRPRASTRPAHVSSRILVMLDHPALPVTESGSSSEAVQATDVICSSSFRTGSRAPPARSSSNRTAPASVAPACSSGTGSTHQRGSRGTRSFRQGVSSSRGAFPHPVRGPKLWGAAKHKHTNPPSCGFARQNPPHVAHGGSV